MSNSDALAVFVGLIVGFTVVKVLLARRKRGVDLTERMEGPLPRSTEECLALLGLGRIATSEEIKEAYRRKMQEYHPDKVAHLGEKLKAVAAVEAQKLNVAYQMLKENGYLTGG